MIEEIGRLQAALVARMQELGTPVTDPRLAPMLGQLQALIRQQYATAGANGTVTMLSSRAPAYPAAAHDGPAAKLVAELPPRLKGLAEGYIRFVRSQGTHFFAQAPALSEADAGRELLQLDAADKAIVAVQAYTAWTSERYGGTDGSALRRIVSDLLRAKLCLTDAQAIALVKAAIRHGFEHASYSPIRRS